jgi:adenylate cyclase
MNPDKIQKFYLNPQIFKVAIATSVLSILLSLSGIFQSAEWSLWDHYFRWRSHEAKDPDVVVVTIDEQDSAIHSEWPISDALLAELLEKVRAQEPRAIGLNLFRNLPIGAGKEELQEVFRTTPNLIAAKKMVGTTVAPPEILEAKNQIGFSDLMVDRDGVVRRALIAINSEDGQSTEASLGTQLALKYLEKEGINVESDYQPKYRMPFDHRRYFRLGKVVFSELEKNDGGYVRSDSGGFQLLLNYRSGSRDFYTITMRDLLKDKIPPELVRDVHTPPLKDRIVLIGITTESDGNNIATPFDRVAGNVENTPGVFIHAHIASQFVHGAKQGRLFFQAPIQV